MDEGTETTRTARADGITVRKTVDGDGHVRLAVESERDSVATVRLTDPALESRSIEEIQFDTEYSTDWVIEDASIFEGKLEPDEHRTLGYRVPDADAETLETEPQLSVSDGPDLEEITDRARSDRLREFVGGERDSLGADSGAEPAVDTTDETDTDNGVAADLDTSVRVPDDGGGGVPSDEGVDVSANEDDGARSVAGSGDPSDNVARTLLEELRNDRVDTETAAELRSELGGGSRSQEVRLNHLQSEVSDLAAYTDTIESFIDRHGTFDSVVDDVRAELSALEDRTDRVEATVEANSEAVGRIDDIDDELEAVRSTQSELESRLEEIQEMQTEFDSRFDRLEDDLGGVYDRLDELEAFERRLSGALRGLGSDSSDS